LHFAINISKAPIHSETFTVFVAERLSPNSLKRRKLGIVQLYTAASGGQNQSWDLAWCWQSLSKSYRRNTRSL